MQLVTYVSVPITVIAAPLGVLGATVASEDVEHSADTQFQQSEFDADRVLLRFDVRDNGTAVGRVEYRFALNGTNRSAFTQLQRDITSNQTAYLDRFERRVTQTVWTAENTTDRPMGMMTTGTEGIATIGMEGMMTTRTEKTAILIQILIDRNKASLFLSQLHP